MSQGVGSKLRYGSDVLLGRLMRFKRLRGYNEPRSISLRGGTRLQYRLNRGDIQGLREVWMDNAYALPFQIEPKIVVDLGANIGLTSVWFHRRFKCEYIIAVEANAGNVQIARQNFALNSVPGQVIEAAIGPEDGVGKFQSYDESNLGRICSASTSSDRITTVPIISMESVLGKLPHKRRVDLLKIDIEGGEAALFSRNTDWLGDVDSIVAELHSDYVDCDAVVRTLEAAGFLFITNKSAFIRRDHPAARPFLDCNS